MKTIDEHEKTIRFIVTIVGGLGSLVMIFALSETDVVGKIMATGICITCFIMLHIQGYFARTLDVKTLILGSGVYSAQKPH